MREQADEATRLLAAARTAFTRGSPGSVADIRLNGHPVERLPGNLNLSFAGVEGEALMMAMRDVAVSSGSACSSTNPEPSHVLLAMGLSEDLAGRASDSVWGDSRLPEEVDFAVGEVAEPSSGCGDWVLPGESGWRMI